MIRSILLATDGSDTAKKAARMAADIAECSGGVVTVLSVARPIVYPGDMAPVQATYSDEPEKAARAIAEEQAEELRREGLRAETRVEIADSVDRVIVETAEETHADLVVMGTHGRTGLARAFLGSVADKVLRSGKTPVLLAKRDDG